MDAIELLLKRFEDIGYRLYKPYPFDPNFIVVGNISDGFDAKGFYAFTEEEAKAKLELILYKLKANRPLYSIRLPKKV